MKVYIIGTGLIGGSFALDIQQEYPEAIIYGVDLNAQHIKEALECGVIHEEASFEDLQNAEVVFLTIPVDVAFKCIAKSFRYHSGQCVGYRRWIYQATYL
jgi:prephenate dehydrogenase